MHWDRTATRCWTMYNRAALTWSASRLCVEEEDRHGHAAEAKSLLTRKEVTLYQPTPTVGA